MRTKYRSIYEHRLSMHITGSSSPHTPIAKTRTATAFILMEEICNYILLNFDTCLTGDETMTIEANATHMQEHCHKDGPCIKQATAWDIPVQ